MPRSGLRYLAMLLIVGAAIRELVDLGPVALPPLHRAVRDPRPEVVQWALFATTGLAGTAKGLTSVLNIWRPGPG